MVIMGKVQYWFMWGFKRFVKGPVRVCCGIGMGCVAFGVWREQSIRNERLLRQKGDQCQSN